MNTAAEGAEMSRNAHLLELDTRTSNGITVTLFWSRATGSVSLVVVDNAAGESFDLEIDPADARDAFHHPYAYAAYRGVPELIAA
jgi:hypothetical protein